MNRKDTGSPLIPSDRLRGLPVPLCLALDDFGLGQEIAHLGTIGK